MSKDRPKILLIDGFHTAFRAFYAIPGLATRQGLPTNAVYGFLQIVRKLLREEQPEYVAVAWDVSDRTFRTERFGDYKANRAPMPEELRVQLPYLRRAIEALSLPILELEHYEADDVMGSIGRQAAAAGYEVVLVSADKDLLQLVGPGIRLFHTGRNRLYGPAEVEQDLGLRPEQIPDYLALVGDSIDNLPGVPGIGEKGAQRLLAEYGDLESLLAHANQLPRKAYRESLTQHADRARMSRELATIHTDLPLQFDPEALRLRPPSASALRELATELELRSILEELQPTAAIVNSLEGLVELSAGDSLKALLDPTPGTVHVAWVGSSHVELLALEPDRGKAAWFDLRTAIQRQRFAEELRLALNTPNTVWIGHDLKELLRVAGGARPQAELFDLLLSAYLLEASSSNPSLDELARKWLGQELPPLPRGSFEEVRPEVLVSHLRVRLAATRALAPKLRSDLAADRSLKRLYEELEAPLLPLLVQMEEAGILLDQPLLLKLSRELGQELERLEARAFELAGEQFNLNSPQQLGSILFERMGLPTVRKTRKKRAWSTDAETLQELARQGHELPQLLLRYRELAKLKSTYVDALPTLVGADGRIHTRFQQAVAATGRLSSINPNLQNIPVRTELGQRIRRAFRAPEGWVLLAADYSQIELRVLAHIAQDEQLIEAFRSGEDIHRTTASLIFGVSVAEVTAEQRRAAKTINFGLIYGMSSYGLSQALNVPQPEAEQFIHSYFARFGGVHRYMREIVERAESERRVTTLFGRVRPLPELASPSFAVRENARRIAINTPIQGTAADILKRAMLRVDTALSGASVRARILLTVHDELVLEVPQAEVESVAPMVREAMEGAASLAVPLVVELGWGPTWGDAKG